MFFSLWAKCWTYLLEPKTPRCGHLRQTGRRPRLRLYPPSSRQAPWRIGSRRAARTRRRSTLARPRRPFLWREYSSTTISARPLCCGAGCAQDYPPAGIAAVPRVVLESALSRSDFPDHHVIAEELTENVIDLEGHDLVVVPLGHT